MTGAPGRLQLVARHRTGASVYVDYAHKPEALETVLSTLRPFAHGRLVVVFGCGGDRDAGKRPLMGQVAAELADDIVLTDDNPRTESPQSIVADTARGIPAGSPYRIEHDRARAIHDSLVDAHARDVVIVAGKGHEDYQIYGRERRAFSDQKVVTAALAARAGSTA